METERSEQVDQNEYREWLDLARNSHSASTTYFDANIRPEVEKNLRQFQGLHPKGSKYLAPDYKNRSKLFRPKTRASVRKNEAVCAGAFFSSEDVVAMRPQNDNDPYSRAGAELYKSLLQYRLTKPYPHGIPWFLTLVGAYQEAMTCMVVASKQDWEFDPAKGVDRPRITLKPVENIRIDPAADWTDPINSSPYLIDMVPMYVGDIKKRMSVATDPRQRWFHLSEAEIRSAVRNTGDSTRLTRENQRTDRMDDTNAVTDYTIAWVHENIVTKDGQDWVYWTLGTEYMLTAPLPLKEVYFHGIRPFVMGYCVLEAHRIYPTAKVALARDTQKELNEIINERRDNVKRMLDPRWKALKNKQVDLRSLTRNVPSSVTLLNSLSDAELIETPDATAACFAEQDRVNGDFDEIAGNFSSSSVQNNRRMNETVGGLELLSDDANVVGEYELRVFTETWVEPVLRQVVLLEREHETDELILMLAAEAAGILKEGMTAEHLDLLLQEDVLLSVNVGIGTTNPRKQLERFIGVTKAALELLGPEMKVRLKPEEVIKELFGKAGYKDGARFFDMSEQQEDPMAQLERLVVEAKLELTKAQAEKAHEDAKQSQAAKVVKMVEALYSAMQAGQVAASAPGAVPVADAIALSAGYQDQNAPPLIPEVIGAAAEPAQLPGVQENTSPMFPAVPAGPGEGMMRGIETQENDGVKQ
jgi:hypothetical protein